MNASWDNPHRTPMLRFTIRFGHDRDLESSIASFTLTAATRDLALVKAGAFAQKVLAPKCDLYGIGSVVIEELPDAPAEAL